jgi:DDE superfamily endonuclease
MDSDDDDDQHAVAMRRRFFLLAALVANKRKGSAHRFRYRLNEEGRRRRDRNIPRNALPAPKDAPSPILYQSGDDGALITITGFDHETFSYILGKFEPYFNDFTPWTKSNDGGFSYVRLNQSKSKGRGRRRDVNSVACLGLVLSWYRFRGSEFILQGWFGFTGTQTNAWLRFGRRMLLLALKDCEECLVRFPDDETIEVYKEAVARRHESLKNVYCVADGLKIPFEACDGLTDQSKFYNGWLHGHYITNLFVFGADGRILNAIINVPGSVHDSTLAIWGGTYRKLKDIHARTGGICCVDSAFASGKAPYLIKSAQDHNTAKSAKELIMYREATSLRQAAEWGIRAIQGSMPRLKDALHYEEKGERKRIMKLVPLLYNLRLSRVGLNQIANTYLPHWSKDANYYVKTKTG